jgi:hypothetical protein
MCFALGDDFASRDRLVDRTAWALRARFCPRGKDGATRARTLSGANNSVDNGSPK